MSDNAAPYQQTQAEMIDELESRERTDPPGVATGAKIAGTAKIHPSAVIETGVEIGENCEVGPDCFVGRGSKLMPGSKLAERACIGPDCVIGEGATIGTGATLRGRNSIGRNTVVASDDFNGRDTVLDYGATVGDECVIPVNTIMERDARIGDHSKFNASMEPDGGNHFGAACQVGDHVHGAGDTDIGARAKIEPHVVLEYDSRVAAGATVREWTTVKAREEVPGWSVREQHDTGALSPNESKYEAERLVDGLHPEAVAEACEMHSNVRTGANTRFGLGARIAEGGEFGKNCSIGADAKTGKDVKVRRDTSIGDGSELHDDVEVGAYCEVGKNVTIETGASIGPGTVIGDGAHIGFGVAIPAGSRIGEATTIRDGARFDGLEIRTGTAVHLGPGRYGSGVDIGAGSRTEGRVNIGIGVRCGEGVLIKTPTGVTDGADVPANTVLERPEEHRPPPPRTTEDFLDDVFGPEGQEIPPLTAGGPEVESDAKTPAPKRPSDLADAGAGGARSQELERGTDRTGGAR